MAPGYTDTIGQDLAIIGAAMPPPDPDAGLTAEAEVRASEVVITLSKKGHLGLWIEGQVRNDTTWSFLAIDTTIPYNDTRPFARGGPSPRCAATDSATGMTARAMSGRT
jgi:hypothetical protein